MDIKVESDGLNVTRLGSASLPAPRPSKRFSQQVPSENSKPRVACPRTDVRSERTLANVGSELSKKVRKAPLSDDRDTEVMFTTVTVWESTDIVKLLVTSPSRT